MSKLGAWWILVVGIVLLLASVVMGSVPSWLPVPVEATHAADSRLADVRAAAPAVDLLAVRVHAPAATFSTIATIRPLASTASSPRELLES